MFYIEANHIIQRPARPMLLWQLKRLALLCQICIFFTLINHHHHVQCCVAKPECGDHTPLKKGCVKIIMEKEIWFKYGNTALYEYKLG